MWIDLPSGVGKIDELPYKHVTKCSGCHLVFYCSLECHKKDRKEHGRVCRHLRLLRAQIEGQERTVRRTIPHVGHLHLSHPYAECQNEWIQESLSIALELNCVEVWNDVCDVMQDLDRMQFCMMNGTNKTKQRFLFTLLRLNRDDQAFEMAVFLARHFFAKEELRAFIPLVETSLRGDWVYPSLGRNCRYRDFIKQDVGFIHKEKTHLDCYIFVAVFIIKMKLVATLMSAYSAFQCFLATELGQKTRSSGVSMHIMDYLVDTGHQKDAFGELILEQQRQIDELACHIDERLPSLLWNMAKYNAKQPLGDIHLTDHHIISILTSCWKTIGHVPGLKEYIIRRRRTARIEDSS